MLVKKKKEKKNNCDETKDCRFYTQLNNCQLSISYRSNHWKLSNTSDSAKSFIDEPMKQLVDNENNKTFTLYH